MNVVEFLTTNMILNLSIASWAIAQVLKGLIILIRERRLDLGRMLDGGGMPSSHSLLCMHLRHGGGADVWLEQPAVCHRRGGGRGGDV